MMVVMFVPMLVLMLMLVAMALVLVMMVFVYHGFRLFLAAKVHCPRCNRVAIFTGNG